MEKILAPIILFVYNRPWHALLTLEALSKNPLAEQSRLFIYSDGPKFNCSNDEHQKILQVREIIRTKKWCKEVEIIERKKNLGIEISEINAITEKVNEYGKVIILEDDHETAPGFLEFINRGLDIYENVSNVYAINGYAFNINYPIQKAVLMPICSSWGWGTWKKKWSAYDPSLKHKNVILNNKFLRQRFNAGDYDYCSLLDHPDNPWDIRWTYSVFMKNGLCLFPTQSLVKNIGFDGSGTHYKNKIKIAESQLGPEVMDFELSNEIDLEYYSAYLNYHKSEKKSHFKKIINKFRKLI